MEDTEITFFNVIRNGDLSKVEALIAMAPELINSKDNRGSTPLILATYYDHAHIANLLLENGAEIDTKDASGNTALMGVCFKGYTKIAEKLIEKAPM